jgi:hypothetical protein
MIFGLLLISQFWTVANLVYDPRQAKRVFGFIGGGAPLGGIAGSALALWGANAHRGRQPAAAKRGTDARLGRGDGLDHRPRAHRTGEAVRRCRRAGEGRQRRRGVPAAAQSRT